MQIIFKLFIAAVSLSLVSCAAIKPIYKNADTLAYFWLNDYIGFNLDQKVRVKNELLETLTWHRKTQLPTYTKLAKEWSAIAERDITASQLCGTWEQQIKPLQTPFTAHLEPSVLWLATHITPEQITHLTKAYAKANTKWKKEWMPESKELLIKHTLKNQRERLEHLYGKLSDVQTKTLQEAAARSPFDAKIALANREFGQQEVLRTLKEIQSKHLNESSAKPLMSELLTRLNTPKDQAYAAYNERIKTHNCEIFASVHNSMDKRHREHLKQKLLGYAADFESLSKN